ncbi:hypothetical protein YTPLAS72_27350 [Nitrospira sp.]|nr:hypothetical protein YTPLAS72_27350 [Nitrospira sp.]
MDRAVVLIGVSKTGDCPALQAVHPGVQRMAQWARSQGMTEENKRLRVLTDETAEVRAHQITDVIEAIVARTTVEQLIVYFSGHGVNNHYSEYWLLSRAPGNANEAINVKPSLELAKFCGIGHVVVISDACRTAAHGIQALQISGSVMFPNESVTEEEQSVDVFYACARGRPACEVKDLIGAAREYSGIYTEVLTECLNGDHAELLEEDDEDSTRGLVRPKRLKNYLQNKVPERLRSKIGRELLISQIPDAQINSHNTWLSRISGYSATASQVIPVSRSPWISPFRFSEALVAHAMANDVQQWRQVLTSAATVPSIAPLKEATETYLPSFGPTHFETRCGFKLRGAQVEQVYCYGTKINIVDSDGSLIRVEPLSKYKALVLIELRNGTGVVMPAIPDFIGALIFDQNELVSVSYEPSSNTSRWNEYARRQEEFRMLRASIAASIGLGLFRLTVDEALTLIRQLRIAEGVDPSLALYVAYACHDLQRRDLIKKIGSDLSADLGVTFFDVGLLGGDQGEDRSNSNLVTPPFPMLAQGWPLLPAFHAKCSALLNTLHLHLLPSVWTLFDQRGVARLKAAITAGEIR